jgi:hypothetical protein
METATAIVVPTAGKGKNKTVEAEASGGYSVVAIINRQLLQMKKLLGNLSSP